MSDQFQWLKNQHPLYSANLHRWQYSQDHYSGECAEPGKASLYVPQREVGESDAAYKERLANIDFKPHLATAIDSIVGMLFGAESQANYITHDEKSNRGLGDRTDKKSLAGRLEFNADGNGNGRIAVMKQLTREVLITDWVWQMIDFTAQKPAYSIIQPQAVTNWWYNEAGILAGVVIVEKYDTRLSLQQSYKEGTRYLVLTIDGWLRFNEIDGNITFAGGDEGQGAYQYYDRDLNRILPIKPVNLGLNRPISYQLARMNNSIMNQQSQLDHQLRNSSFPLLNVVGSDEFMKKIQTLVGKGAKVLQNEPGASSQHGFIVAPTESATIQRDVIKEKEENFHRMAFQQFGDAAKEKTASQIKHESQSGIQAFLQILKTVVDDAENWYLDLIAQAEWKYGSAGFSNWWKASIERDDTFQPLDTNETIESLKAVVLGTEATPALPVGRSTQIEAMKEICVYMGLPFTDEELAAKIDMLNLERGTAAMGALGIELPGEAKAEIAMRYLRSAGLVTDEDKVRLDDGTEVSKYKVWLASALELSEGSDMSLIAGRQPSASQNENIPDDVVINPDESGEDS